MYVECLFRKLYTYRQMLFQTAQCIELNVWTPAERQQSRNCSLGNANRVSMVTIAYCEPSRSGFKTKSLGGRGRGRGSVGINWLLNFSPFQLSWLSDLLFFFSRQSALLRLKRLRVPHRHIQVIPLFDLINEPTRKMLYGLNLESQKCFAVKILFQSLEASLKVRIKLGMQCLNQT